MSEHTIVVAHNASDEAADGLALAHLLAERLGRGLVVTRVVSGDRHRVTSRAREMFVREAVGETRQALVALLPDAADVEIVPLLEESVSRALHELAEAEDAAAIVVGSSHLHGFGRLLLGTTPETVANGSPCPVFVAPVGFRDAPALSPGVIGVAYDGTPAADHALAYAVELAEALAMDVRLVAVRPSLLHRPLGTPRHFDAVLAAGAERARTLSGGAVAVSTAELEGDTAEVLGELPGSEVGLLVLGSHHRGTIGRLLLGSVSSAVIRAARGPVVVTPRG